MDHFIGQIEIENFRCFDFLKVENLKRVNLVGGDNNVGKSAFLEALEIVAKTTDSSSLSIALTDSVYRRRPEIVSKTITPLYLLTAVMGNIIRNNSRFGEFDFDLIRYEQSILQFKTDIKNIRLRLRPDDQSSLSKLAIESDREGKFEGLSAEIIIKDIPPLKMLSDSARYLTDKIYFLMLRIQTLYRLQVWMKENCLLYMAKSLIWE